AEDKSGGGFNVLWENDDGRYSGWVLDAAGNRVSGFKIDDIVEHETTFQKDFNDDGDIGLPSMASSGLPNSSAIGTTEADTFHFSESGPHSIINFDDTIDLIEFDTDLVSSFSQLTFIDSGDDVLVAYNNGSILVENFDLALLSVDDFKFV
ncbi:MAG: hypothetical protein ABJL55_23605, partial [Roseibium sp.]